MGDHMHCFIETAHSRSHSFGHGVELILMYVLS